jgi:hypothetical protein
MKHASRKQPLLVLPETAGVMPSEGWKDMLLGHRLGLKNEAGCESNRDLDSRGPAPRDQPEHSTFDVNHSSYAINHTSAPRRTRTEDSDQSKFAVRRRQWLRQDSPWKLA